MEENNLESQKAAEKTTAKFGATGNTKKILYVILAVVVLTGILGAVKIQEKRDADRKAKTTSVTGAKQEIDTTTEEEKVLKAQAENYWAQIKKLPGTASQEEKFGLYSKLAAAQYKLGDYKDAIASLDAVAADNQNNHRMWTMYTNIYWDMQDFAKARESSAKALELDKENPQSWLAFIELLEDQGRENIDAKYEVAIDKTDSAIEVVVAYAKFLEKHGDKTAAIKQWTEAARIVPTKKAEYEAEIGRLQQ